MRSAGYYDGAFWGVTTVSLAARVQLEVRPVRVKYRLVSGQWRGRWGFGGIALESSISEWQAYSTSRVKREETGHVEEASHFVFETDLNPLE